MWPQGSLCLCLRGYSAAWAVISCEILPCQSEGWGGVGGNKSKQLKVVPLHQTRSVSDPQLISQSTILSTHARITQDPATGLESALFS